MSHEKLIAIYGGTRLTPLESEFIKNLAFLILSDSNEESSFSKIKLVTGGFRYKKRDNPESKSTDEAVLDGSKKFSNLNNIPLEECLETWLPKSGNRPNVDRFKAGNVKIIPGNNQVRRLSLVEKIDAIITFSGKIETSLVLDAAFANEKLFFPLPFSGGDSKEYWDRYRINILNSFEISEEVAGYLETTILSELNQSEVIRASVDVIIKGLKKQIDSVPRVDVLNKVIDFHHIRLIERVQDTCKADISDILKLINQAKEKREIEVKDLLITLYSMTELKSLCFDLNINYEELEDRSTLTMTAQSLVSYMKRRNEIERLINKIKRDRPFLLVDP